MTKRVVAIIAAVLVVAVTICSFVKVDVEEKVVIRASMLNTFRELSSPAEWQKWHPAFASACAGGGCGVIQDNALKIFTLKASGYSLRVKNEGASFIITDTVNGKSRTYCYNAIPSLQDDSTTILVVRPKTILQAVFHLSANGNENVAIDSLKSYIETPAKYYGFNIEVHPVIDTIVVTTKKTVPAKAKYAEIQDLYNKMNGFIAANHLTITQPCIMHYYKMGNDSLKVEAGIPVNKTAQPRDGITFMKMPANAHMLVGYYKGSFAGRTALYAAMNKYVQDHFLRLVAATYEKYLNNRLPNNDSSQVEIALHFPIY
ncbi:MAG TPA: hypothetical protein VHB48_00940 [Chitinophagaceae bacterium]|nr:hypothetical protein [Chitinophagaceae bacterium]